MHKTSFPTVYTIAVISLILFLAASSSEVQSRESRFDLTGTNISGTFAAFIKCNEGILPSRLCEADPAAPEFLFDADTVNNLKKYYFILIPGGDIDFFAELLGLCNGKVSEDFINFENQHPKEANAMKQGIINNVCPAYEANGPSYYSTKFIGSYEQYAAFFRDNGLAYKVLEDYVGQSPSYIGNRGKRLDLLVDTIESAEAENGNAEKIYVLIGHSFGGLTIADFLVELAGGHVPDTPEYKLFENTRVRQWTGDQKEKIFNKIKGAVFLNTLIQGDGGPEARLKKIAQEDKLRSADPLKYYIEYILENYPSGTMPETSRWEQILHDTLLTARYRTDYYLKDKNTIAKNNGSAIQNAFDRIAGTMAIISIGSVVPRLFPDMRVGANFMVYKSKKKWEKENRLNDGMLDSLSSVFPRASADYAMLFKLDHGTLVMKPTVQGISSADIYDQIPFLKTLLTRLEKKLAGLQTK